MGAAFVYAAHPLGKMLTPTIQRFDSIDSTNLEAMRQAKAGANEGVCIIAREQTQGRGRLDRSWHSPKDAGLYFSMVLRPAFEIGRWPLINLAAALACSEALAKVCQLTVNIKWPNDICVADRKLGGILAEAIETAAGAAVVLGMGINLNSQSLPPHLNDIATSIESVSSLPIDRESLTAELIRATTRRYEMLRTENGAEGTIRDWCANSSYAYDRAVRVTLHDESFEGVTRGLESDGALRVATSDGGMKIVRAGDVSALRAVSFRDSDQ
jgi:BirA family biotin operon repressor/biotin-[acetyl-CoA-carboxylase] ligase